MATWEKRDEKEQDPQYRAIFKVADRKAERKTKKKKGQLGWCHFFWGEKKRILKEKYHIDWKSPAELNPRCKYD